MFVFALAAAAASSGGGKICDIVALQGESWV